MNLAKERFESYRKALNKQAEVYNSNKKYLKTQKEEASKIDAHIVSKGAELKNLEKIISDKEQHLRGLPSKEEIENFKEKWEKINWLQQKHEDFASAVIETLRGLPDYMKRNYPIIESDIFKIQNIVTEAANFREGSERAMGKVVEAATNVGLGGGGEEKEMHRIVPGAVVVTLAPVLEKRKE